MVLAWVLLFWVLLFWVLPWVIGGLSAMQGRIALGILRGVLQGWIGVIIVAVLPPTHAELLRRERERLLIQQQASSRYPATSLLHPR